LTRTAFSAIITKVYKCRRLDSEEVIEKAVVQGLIFGGRNVFTEPAENSVTV